MEADLAPKQGQMKVMCLC